MKKDLMVKKCLFCDKKFPAECGIFLENDSHYSKWDKHPVASGHALIVSKRHVRSFFDLTKKEFLDIQELILRTRQVIDKKYKPEGYNIGINEGEVAGQTISHLHLHLIPRYRGDVEDPVGGMRNVIPSKGNYRKNPNL